MLLWTPSAFPRLHSRPMRSSDSAGRPRMCGQYHVTQARRLERNARLYRNSFQLAVTLHRIWAPLPSANIPPRFLRASHDALLQAQVERREWGTWRDCQGDSRPPASTCGDEVCRQVRQIGGALKTRRTASHRIWQQSLTQTFPAPADRRICTAGARRLLKVRKRDCIKMLCQINYSIHKYC